MSSYLAAPARPVLSAANVAAIRAIESGLFIHGMMLLLTTATRKLYTYDTSSVAADDGDLVIKPTDVSGAGRWLFLPLSQGVSNSAQRLVGIAGRQATVEASGDGETLGAFIFDKASIPTSPVVFRFHGVIGVGVGGQTATLQLFDFTNGVQRDALTSTSTTPEHKTSASTLTLASGEVLYLVRLKRTGGSASDPVFAFTAYLEVTAT